MNKDAMHLELSDMVENLYKHGRQIRSMENKPRYYGSDMLLYPNEIYTLKAIAQHEGINQTELSEAMFRTKGATSTAVQKLVQKGLVEQRTGGQDLRFSQLYPTPKGMEIHEAHLEYDLKYVDVLCQRLNLNREDLANVNRVLRLMTNDFSMRTRLGENIMNDGSDDTSNNKSEAATPQVK